MHERFLISLLYDTPIFAQTRICKLFENKVYNLDIIIRVYCMCINLKDESHLFKGFIYT